MDEGHRSVGSSLVKGTFSFFQTSFMQVPVCDVIRCISHNEHIFETRGDQIHPSLVDEKTRVDFDYALVSQMRGPPLKERSHCRAFPQRNETQVEDTRIHDRFFAGRVIRRYRGTNMRSQQDGMSLQGSEN